MFWRRTRSSSDFEEELRAHLDLETQRLISEGLDPAEAASAARRAFGNVTAVKERFFESSRARRVDGFVQDLRFACRTFRKDPAFTAGAVLTLALAIGANTAMFTVVNAVAFRPLPYTAPERIVWITQVLRGNSTDEVTITPDFLDWRRLNRSFEHLAGFNYQQRTVTGEGDPMQVESARASAALLPALGIQPALGRNFRREEDLRGSHHVVILTHGLWQRRFGSDPKVLGRSVTLDGEPYEIVGILPARFLMPGEAQVELLTPLAKNEAAELLRSDSVSIVRNVIGRLKPGVTAGQALSDLHVIQAGLPQLPWKPRITIRMLSIRARMLGETERAAAWILMAATALLLFVACANVSSLLLAKGTQRIREMALRSSLGASRRRLVSQFLIEGLLLAGLAGALGFIAANATRTLLFALSSSYLPGVDSLPLDGRVLSFSIVLVLLTVLIFGLGPAIRLTDFPIAEALKRAGMHQTANRGDRRLLRGVAAAEIALTFILLVSAGLLLRSFIQLRYANLGFQTDRLVVAILKLPPARAERRARQEEFLQRLEQAMRTIPGVESVALSEADELPPGIGHATNTYRVEGMPEAPPGQRPVARHQPVTAGYFSLLRIPLRRGRLLGTQDGAQSPKVIVINEALAARSFAGVNPLGHRIRGGFVQPDWWTVVGIAGNVRTSGLAAKPEPTIYYPLEQSPKPEEVAVVLRTPFDAGTMAGQIRSKVTALDPLQPVALIQSMDDRLSESVGQPRLVTILVSAFAILATLLGLVGVYSVMACSLRWQARDLAIRSALGARPAQVKFHLLRQGGMIILAGVAAGAAGALVVTQGLRSLLFEVGPRDPSTFAAAAILLGGCAALACWLPARRAARVNPAAVLRSD